MNNQEEMIHYALSFEELALALGLAGHPELGRGILVNVYENLTDERADALLTAASHSLVARGCTRIENNHAVLSEPFRAALSPILEFDALLNLTLVHGQESGSVMIRLQRNGRFTAQMVRLGVVHVLESGPLEQLPAYLMEMTKGFGSGAAAGPATPEALPVPLRVIADAIKTVEGGNKPDAAILPAWSSEHRSALLEDLQVQTGRATLLMVNAGSSSTAEESAAAEKKIMILLKGNQRSWLFNFPATADDAVGIARIASQPEFGDELIHFIR